MNNPNQQEHNEPGSPADQFASIKDRGISLKQRGQYIPAAIELKRALRFGYDYRDTIPHLCPHEMAMVHKELADTLLQYGRETEQSFKEDAEYHCNEALNTYAGYFGEDHEITTEVMVLKDEINTHARNTSREKRKTLHEVIKAYTTAKAIDEMIGGFISDEKCIMLAPLGENVNLPSLDEYSVDWFKRQNPPTFAPALMDWFFHG